MLPENYLLFLQIIIVMFVTPGGPRVLILSQSINYGFGKSLWTAFGDVTANCIQMLLVLFGLGALLKIFPDIVILFKWVGVSYLLYVAYGFYKSKANIDINTGKQVKSNILLFRDGFFIAFFSPKAASKMRFLNPLSEPLGRLGSTGSVLMTGVKFSPT